MGNYQAESNFLKASDGIQIYWQGWFPQTPNSKTLVIAHGLGEHSGRYKNLVDYFVPLGYTIFAADHRGHGRSGGRRGHINRFQEYYEDLHRVVQHVQKHQPNSQLYLIGHSLGGLIAIHYALNYPETLHGLIVSSPALQLKMKIPAVKAALGKWLSAIWPTLAMANGIDINDLSHDTDNVEQYRTDPLVHNRASTRYFTEFLDAMDAALAGAGNLKLPLLMLQAGADPIIDPAGSQDFFNRVTLSDKELIIYDDFYHEIFNEVDRQRVLTDLEKWLEQH